MPRSYAETTTLHCPDCGQPFEAEIWLTVDAAERADLVARIGQGTLHAVTCPHCGGRAAVDAPLLVHDPGHQRLLFAPPQGSSQEQDQQMAGQLAGRLAETFLYPRPAYLGQIQAVPPELLGLALEAGDPAALQAALEEQLRAALADDPRLAAVQALIAADSPAAVMEAAREHPILLADEGQAFIRQGIENARQMGQEDLAGHIEARYEALQQLAQLGATPEQLAALAQVAEAIPPEVQEVLDELGPVSSEAELEEKLRRRPDLLEKLKALRQAASPDQESDLADRLIEWVQTPTWADSKTYLENHPELLADEAEQVLARLSEVQDNEGARRTLEEHLALLHRCRAEGIAAAFAEKTGGGGGPGLGDIPPEVEPVLREVARLTGRADMPRRIELCQQALRQVDREENPVLWAALQNELANSLLETPLGERAENIERAIHHYTQALEVYTPEAWPERSRGVHSRRGHAHFTRADWAAAHADYEVAIRQAEQVLLTALLEEAEEQIAADISRAYANDTYTLARLGQPRPAWERGESGRTRTLREALARREMESALDELPPEIRQPYRQAWQEEQALRRQMKLPEGTPGHLSYPEARPLLEAARARRQEAATHIQAALPDLVPAGLTWEDFQAQATLPEGSALAGLTVTEHGTLALLVTSDAPEPRPLFIETFTTSDLETPVADLPDQVREWIGAYNRQQENPTGWLAAMVSIAVREGQIEAGWYFLYRLAGVLQQTSEVSEDFGSLAKAARYSAVLAWRAAIQRTIEALGHQLWPPLAQALAEMGADRVILVPQGTLFLLPLHAAAPQGLTVAYAPNASVWAAVAGQDFRSLGDFGSLNVLIAANPTGDLPYTPSEAQAIADLFHGQAQVLWREQVTAEALLAAAAEADILHYSGHGEYNWADPQASGLRLLSTEKDKSVVLSLAEIREQLRLGQTRLVSLSACETGLTSIEPGQADEYVGLPAGFLLAGAPAVVASLWSVDDLSTALLMERFYRLHLGYDTEPSAVSQTYQVSEDFGSLGRQPLPIAGALAQAQKWLRELGKEEAMAQVRRLQQMWRERRGRSRQEYDRALRQYWRLERARYRIQDGKEDQPFGHPFHWAAFQAVGAVF